ncbi:hypothetical protein CI610_01309 [invertebrate metagenome]|uniref:Membrane transporter protein n=1 Tax=invertebrate metagenome TaxID=1711999 RepID=A0A2H9T922_9ZZZZ
MILLLYLLLGSIAGILAGLFGIGGGLIIVPALVYSFSLQGIDPEVLTHLAIGTSLATIVVTSISSIRAHNKHKGVLWHLFFCLVPGIMLGSWLGVYTAFQLDGAILQKIFGVFALLMAIRMWCGFSVSESQILPKAPWLAASGGFIGFCSSLFGIGGGSIAVPLLSRFHIPMSRSVGTAAATGLPIAVIGTLSNIVLGYGDPQLPQLATGFVYWPAFGGIVVTSLFFARWGAKLAHRSSPSLLQKLFAVFLMLVSIDFLLVS